MAKNSNTNQTNLKFFINFKEVSSEKFIFELIPKLARHRKFLNKDSSILEEMQEESADLFVDILSGSRYISEDGDVYTIREKGEQFF